MTAWRLETHEVLDSTSDSCIARARAGEPAGLAILAKTQTAGRGSRGRVWQAPAGNLNLSILLRPAVPAARLSLFPLLAGLAVAEALDGFLPHGARTGLKWPNDVLLGGRKLAGILVDAEPGLDGAPGWLVLGIGANLRHMPEMPGLAATTLAAHGGAATPDAAARAVLARLAHWLAALEQDDDAGILEAWLGRAHPLGTALSVRGRDGVTEGSFAGLSPRGELLLAQGDVLLKLHTGDILLGAA